MRKFEVNYFRNVFKTSQSLFSEIPYKTSLITRLRNDNSLQIKRHRAEHAVLGKVNSLQFSSSESDAEKRRRDMNQAMLDDEIFAGPLQKNRFGVLKALCVIVSGIYFGAIFAAIGANMLEELEIFVRDEDDDDD